MEEMEGMGGNNEQLKQIIVDQEYLEREITDLEHLMMTCWRYDLCL